MKQGTGMLELLEFTERRGQFINDRAADVFYWIGGRLVARHRGFLMESEYFKDKLARDPQIMYRIDEDVDVHG
jgi:hypothetical protein